MPASIQLQNEFLKFLIDARVVTPAQVSEIEAHALKDGILPEDVIIRERILSEEELTKRRATFFGLPYIDLSAIRLNSAILQMIPRTVAENYQVVAFDRDATVLKVALADPRNFQAMGALDVLASKQNFRVQYHVASRSGIALAFKSYEELKGEVAESVEVVRKELAAEEKVAPVDEVLKGAPVSRIVSVIMRHGYEGHASDIHIEPHQGGARIRYRIDGVLKTTLTLPVELLSPIVARIKVLANLKFDETRIPQDGRITETIGGRPIDFRVSTLPLQEGQEKVVMRILSTEHAPTLEELGFHPLHIEIIKQNIIRPHGLLLISGPTGAGKSTTLYTVLSLLNREGVNIVTLEDPIEYFISGVNQSQIRAEVDYNFATGLRAILRQDPNVIMVGEIRDPETAELAVHAGLTGHLLLSTIHTNDAVGVIPRLVDLKVEPFLLAATFNVAIAQRLGRKICPDCKEEVAIPESVIAQVRKEISGIPKRYLPVGLNIDGPLTLYHGRGCPRCGTTGYKGRIAIGEILQGTSSLRQLIAGGFNSEQVAKEVREQEMISMKQDAMLKALAGLTTVEEVLRISNE